MLTSDTDETRFWGSGSIPGSKKPLNRDRDRDRDSGIYPDRDRVRDRDHEISPRPGRDRDFYLK